MAVSSLSSLKIEQHTKPTDVVVTSSKLTCEEIGYVFDNVLEKNANSAIEYAEELPGTTDRFRVAMETKGDIEYKCSTCTYLFTMEHSCASLPKCPKINIKLSFSSIFIAVHCILENAESLRGCDHVAPYSDFLGAHVTSNVHIASQHLDNFVPDLLNRRYLLEIPAGKNLLSKCLNSLDLRIDETGKITPVVTFKKKSNRYLTSTVATNVLLQFIPYFLLSCLCSFLRNTCRE